MNNICVNLYVIKFEFLCKICYTISALGIIPFAVTPRVFVTC